VNNIQTSRGAGVLLHTCPRLLPSARAVLKFILGQSLHPINCAQESERFQQLCHKRRLSKKWTASEKYVSGSWRRYVR